MSFRLFDLPAELRAIVFSLLPGPHERAALARTCQLLREQIEEHLYADVVLRDINASRALHLAFKSRPTRLLLVKHITYLYSFGHDDGEHRGHDHDYVHRYRKPGTRITRSESAESQQDSFFSIAGLALLTNLRSFTVQLPYSRPDVFQDYWNSYEWKTKEYCEEFLFRRSRKPYSLVSVDVDFSATQLDLYGLMGLAHTFNIWTLEKIRLSRFDVHALNLLSVYPTDEVEHDVQLVHLNMDSCEVYSVDLVRLLKKTKKLKTLSFSATHVIRGQWTNFDTMEADELAKGRWIDILHATEKASLHTELEVLEFTSRDEHCTIPALDKPLDFAGFHSLKELTLDAHASIKGLPESLHTLTFVRSKNFRGACLPLLENRLREVRRCCLSCVAEGMKRRVIIRIPDRSRGYESLRVMADTWRSIGFEPTIQVDE